MRLLFQTIAVSLALLVLFSFSMGQTSEQFQHLIQNLESSKTDKINELNNHAIHQELKSCETSVPYLKKKLDKITNDKVNLEKEMKKLADDYVKLKEKKPQYEKELMVVIEAYEKKKEHLQKEIKLALQFIKYIKESVQGIKNTKVQEPKDKILGILQEIEKYYEDELKNMNPPPEIEKIKLKMRNLELQLKGVSDKIQQLKGEHDKVEDLENQTMRLYQTEQQTCSAKAEKLEAMKEQLKKDIEEINKKIEELKVLMAKAKDSEERAVKEKLIKDLQSQLVVLLQKKENLTASNPTAECEKTITKKNEDIKDFEHQEKNMTDALRQSAAIVKELEPVVPKLKEQVDSVFTRFGAQQEMCNALALKQIQDPMLLREIESIGKLLDMIAELKNQKKISEETSNTITALLNRIQNDLQKQVKDKHDAAVQATRTCRAAEAELKAEYEKLYPEYKAKKSLLDTESAKVSSLSQGLTALQNAKKVLLKLLDDKTKYCSVAIEQWKKQSAELAVQIQKIEASIKELQDSLNQKK